MDVDKIRIFLSVLKTRNFTATAESLGYTQSAVSQSIKKLEENLGLTLLTRTNKSVTPTSNVQKLLPIMRDLVRAEENLIQTANSINGLETGTLKIGSFASISSHLLPHVFHTFSQDYPGVTLDLIESTYWDIEREVQDGFLDLGFILIPTSADIEYKALPVEPYVAVLPKGHRLSSKTCIDLKELFQEPFVVPSDNFNTEIGKYIKDNHIKVNQAFHAMDDYVIISMVRNQLGVSILPERILKDFSRFVDVRKISPPIYRRLGVAVKSFSCCSPICRKFLEYLFEDIPNFY